jgi:hypothetical protein
MLALLIPTIVPALRQQETRRLARGFIIFHVGVGIWLLFHPLLLNLPNDDRSYMWSFIALFPLLGIAAIDYAGGIEAPTYTEFKDGAHLSFLLFALMAIFLSLLYLCIFYLRFGASGVIHWRWFELLIVVGWSMISHLLIFASLFLLLESIRHLSNKFSAPLKIEFLLCNVLAVVLITLICRHFILPTISFANGLGDAYAIGVSLTAVLYFTGLSVRLNRDARINIRGGLDLTLLLLTPKLFAAKFALLWIIALIVLAYALPVAVAPADWDFLLQKLSVIVIWVLVGAFFYALQQRTTKKRNSVLVLCLIATSSFGLYKLLDFSRTAAPYLLRDDQFDVDLMVERYASFDISFRVVREILSHSIDEHLFSQADVDIASVDHEKSLKTDQLKLDDESFYAFLRQSTNLLPSVQIAPVEIKLVDKLSPTADDKPNIFIFVVDSLRADYLSPYNRRVNFTASIGKFAQESVVMKNAFTRYGGTVLSEPAIWTGTMQLHKQFIEPFYPMNSLQKLLETDAYENYLTIDPVVQIITRPSSSTTELDKGTTWTYYDLCQSLKEVETRLDEKHEMSRPVFVYTQPQNIHARNLEPMRKRAGGASKDADGFDIQYAAELEKIDKGFGEFIDYLKARRLYDNSIVILTSDHGDSLGEEGRWGHSTWVFPEIMRIPLIFHLPPRLQKNLSWDANAVAFSTDITPSLYYLLGHKPIIHNEIYGRPLFTSTPEEQAAYLQESYLLVSSYGPTYGVLRDNGRTLFIADAVNNQDYLYDLTNDYEGKRIRPTATTRTENRMLIRDHLFALNRFYHFNPDEQVGALR